MEQISFLLDKIFRDTLMLPLKTESVTIDSQESNFTHELAYGLLPQSKKTGARQWRPEDKNIHR